MFLSKRSFKKEYLDGEIKNKDLLQQNFKEIERVNALLGGNKCTLDGFKRFSNLNEELTYVDIGCGSGDNILFLANYACKHNIKVHFIGIDLLPEIIVEARIKLHNFKNVSFIASDYRDVLFDKKPDVIYSALFCHHLDDNELISFILWMENNSTRGWFINDLHRHAISYGFIKLICLYPGLTYLFKNDAPLSVQRAFKKKDFIHLLDTNLKWQIHWIFAFRWLVIRLKN